MNQYKPWSKPIFLFESVDLAGTFRDWKSPLLSVEFVFIETFKNLISAHQQLLEKEREFEFFAVEMKNKWERLKYKQAEFINNVKQYDNFFIENVEKSDRISHKIKSKIQLRSKLDQDIRNYKNRIEYLINAEEKLRNSVHQLTPFNSFLEKIIRNIDHFDNVLDLINYYILMNSETQLLDKLNNNMSDNESLSSLIIQSLKSKMVTYHEQKNLILYSHGEYIDSINRKIELEVALQEQKKHNQTTIANVITLRHSSDNIYTQLLKWKKMKPPPNVNFEKKCVFIINTISELREAVKLAQHLYNKKDTSSQADSSFISSRRII